MAILIIDFYPYRRFLVNYRDNKNEGEGHVEEMARRIETMIYGRNFFACHSFYLLIPPTNGMQINPLISISIRSHSVRWWFLRSSKEREFRKCREQQETIILI